MSKIRIEDILRDAGYHLTEPRRLTFKVLRNQNKPQTVEEIRKKLTLTDRATIYRTIKLYTKLGVTTKTRINNSTMFELSDAFREHHHHISCKVCGKIEDIQDNELEQTLKTMASEKGYRLTAHTLELIGICSDHRKSTQ